MNITKAVVQLRGRLIEAINEAGLPPVIVGFVLDGDPERSGKTHGGRPAEGGSGQCRQSRCRRPCRMTRRAG